MSILDRYGKVTDPAKALDAGIPGHVNKALAFLGPDPESVLLGKAGVTVPPAVGRATSGKVIWSGRYKLDGKLVLFNVQLGKERKPADGSRRFGTYLRARAEAAASTKAAVITTDLRVFDTDQPRGFLPPGRTEMYSTGYAQTIRSIHNHEGRDESYADLVEQMKVTSDDPQKTKMVGRILELFFEFNPSDLHLSYQDDYVADKLNVDVLVIGIGGITRFILPDAPEGGQPKFIFDRGQPLPKVGYSVSHLSFDSRTSLCVWNTIVHEEQHARFKRRAVVVLRYFQGVPKTKESAFFFSWLAKQRKKKKTVASATVTDEEWIVFKEQADRIPYVADDGTPLNDNFLSECLSYFEGFKATFHNYNLADFMKADGTFETQPLFNDIIGTENNWAPSYWDDEVKGISARLVKRWTSYIGKLDAAHREAVRNYLLAAPDSANEGFHKTLKSALKL